jgi:hypothetical protein
MNMSSLPAQDLDENLADVQAHDITAKAKELKKKRELGSQSSEDAASYSGLAIVDQELDQPFGNTSPSLAPIPGPMTPRSLGYSRDGTISPRSPISGTTSPSRLPLRSHSPALLSPASSFIFERNVQENTLPDDYAGAIPSHIQTDDQIPPVLEASSIALTTKGLNPSDVEIVTHSAHLPASVVVVANTSQHEFPQSPALSTHQYSELADSTLAEETTSSQAPSYGNIDTTDVRRLSFISFADVVQGEHAETGGSLGASGFLPSSPGRNQSPSPLGSPVSSSSIHKPFALSTSRSPPVPLSPDALVLPSTPAPGELVMEKMSEALKAVENAELHDSATR